MPLLKKKPFPLLEPPKDLEPHEHVYQVRFTKEIFRDYQTYLNQINLYRQRIWTCKISGKINLTYEEALVSEKHATEKVQEIPEEHVAPALRIIQFSMLSLKDLADKIAVKLLEQSLVGSEMHVKRGDDICHCKILKFFDGDAKKRQYEVAWLDKNKKITETGVVSEDDLLQKKFPLSRSTLKSFIRKSTYRSAPWVLHEKLAQGHGISSDPPQELKSKIVIQNGLVCNKRKNVEGKKTTEEGESRKRKKKLEGEKAGEENGETNTEKEDEPIKYPIDDLLVQPSSDDPVFTDRPSPSRDFNIPADCVGNLLMVWDFCSSFGRLLKLSLFSLEDLENAICHKGSSLTLIVEIHSALLRLLVKENGEDLLVTRKRSRNFNITLNNWSEYLCDFLERTNIPDISTCISTIRRGHYGLLDAQAKLGILQELINQATETDAIRDKLDEYIERLQVLGATRREEALEEGRKKRQEKEQLKVNAFANGVLNGHNVENIENNPQSHVSNGNHSGPNGETKKKQKEDDSNHSDTASKKADKGQNMDVEGPAIKSLSKEVLKLMKDQKKEPSETRNREQRREYFEREMEKRVIRTNPLGKDRSYNRYWWFRRDGRIFVESSDSKLWGYYSSKEEVDLLMGSLNHKGERERALHKQLQKFHSRICMELEKRSKDIAQKIALEEAAQRRSGRLRALPRENPASNFLRYVNKWRED